MSLTVVHRTGLPCDVCPAPGASWIEMEPDPARPGKHRRVPVPKNSVVVVEQDGVAHAMCRSHAAVLLGEERLAAVLQEAGGAPGGDAGA